MIENLLKSGLFWIVMAIGLIPYAISRMRGYHFYDECKDESVDWTPWEDVEKAGYLASRAN